MYIENPKKAHYEKKIPKKAGPTFVNDLLYDVFIFPK